MSSWLLKGKKVLVTAGPTREPLNGSEYVSSHHDSNIGFEIAGALLQQGATVFLVSGSVKAPLEHTKLFNLTVNTACEMYMACCRYFEEVDIAIFAAPISPFRPKTAGADFDVLHGNHLNISMVKNMDVEAELSAVKNGKQVTVSISHCSQLDISRAFNTISAKNLDLLVLNCQVPNYDTSSKPSSIILVKSDGHVIPLSPLLSQSEKVNNLIEAIYWAHQQKLAQHNIKSTDLLSMTGTANYLY